MLTPKHIFDLYTVDDVDSLVDHICRQLIRRFLAWTDVQIEALAPLELFTLLDLKYDDVGLCSHLHRFVDSMLGGELLSNRLREIGKLGLYLMLMRLPIALLDENVAWFQPLIQQVLRLIHRHASLWLALCKIVSSIFQHLTYLQTVIPQCSTAMWSPPSVSAIIRSVFFRTTSRYSILASLQLLRNTIAAGKVETNWCLHVLRKVVPVAYEG